MANVPPPVSGYQRFDPASETCPSCQSPNVTAVKYTWWGGVIGPKMLNLHKCNNCKMNFNAKTRQNANTGILLYTVISTVVVVAIVVGIRLAMR
ncbi:MAG: hypothetical protein JST35_11065 [Armatimonadetes bacterium]|nr:hypothetical protein [Armatimonadota bacterium]